MLTAEERKKLDDYNDLVIKATKTRSKALLEQVTAQAEEMLPLIKKQYEESKSDIDELSKLSPAELEDLKNKAIKIVLDKKGVVYVPGEGYVFKYKLKSGGKLFKPLFKKRSMFRQTKVRKPKVRISKTAR